MAPSKQTEKEPTHGLITYKKTKKVCIVPVEKIFRRRNKKLVNIKVFDFKISKYDWHYVLTTCRNKNCANKSKNHEHSYMAFLHELNNNLDHLEKNMKKRLPCPPESKMITESSSEDDSDDEGRENTEFEMNQELIKIFNQEKRNNINTHQASIDRNRGCQPAQDQPDTPLSALSNVSGQFSTPSSTHSSRRSPRDGARTRQSGRLQSPSRPGSIDRYRGRQTAQDEPATPLSALGNVSDHFSTPSSTHSSRQSQRVGARTRRSGRLQLQIMHEKSPQHRQNLRAPSRPRSIGRDRGWQAAQDEPATPLSTLGNVSDHFSTPSSTHSSRRSQRVGARTRQSGRLELQNIHEQSPQHRQNLRAPPRLGGIDQDRGRQPAQDQPATPTARVRKIDTKLGYSKRLISKSPKLPRNFDLYPHGKMGASVPGDPDTVYIGLDIWVGKDVWDSLLAVKKPSHFIIDIATIIWTPTKLINRAYNMKAKNLDLKVNPVSPRKKIEPEKLKLLRDALRYYCKYHRMSEQETRKTMNGNIDRVIQKKIGSLREKYVKKRQDDNQWLLAEPLPENN